MVQNFLRSDLSDASVYRRHFMHVVFLALVLSLLAACGFKLKGTAELPFDTLSLTIPENSQFGADLRRAIRASSPHTRILPNEPTVQGQKPSYDAQLQQVAMTRTSREVSLNPQGRVEEFELTLTFIFRLVDSRGEIIVPDTTLTVVRELPYDDNVVQAKETEAETLFQQMQKSLVDRILRRISAPDVRERYLELKAESQNRSQ